MEKITAILNDFLEQFGLTAEASEDFHYNFDKNIVGYSLLAPAEGVEYLTEFVKSIAPDITCDIFLLSLLHEIGHSETWETLEEEEEVVCRNTKFRISRMMDNASEELLKELYFTYFGLVDEYEATMWAINYMRKNVDMISNFWNKLQAEIIEFYVREGLDLNGC